MKKILILLSFLGISWLSPQVMAQCSSLGCGANPYYFYDLAAYQYFLQNATTATKIAVGIDMGFSALFSSIQLVQQGRALENQINIRRTRLENYKTVKRYYTEGIPPFASRGPDGRPRSPKITWGDVESIR